MRRFWVGVCCALPIALGVQAAHAQCTVLLAERMETPGYQPLTGADEVFEDEYLVGDWDGDGCDNLAVRRGDTILMDIDFDGQHDIEYRYGLGASEDQYLVGDWDGDGVDEIAVRRGNDILMDEDSDGAHDRVHRFGTGPGEDDYLVAETNNDPLGFDDIVVRRRNDFIRDLWPWDGADDGKIRYGFVGEDQYFFGHWSGASPGTRQLPAVRRGNLILMNANFDGQHNFEQIYGRGDLEDEYLVGDWDGDGFDNVAVRRGNEVLMDFDYAGGHELVQVFGNGTRND